MIALFFSKVNLHVLFSPVQPSIYALRALPLGFSYFHDLNILPLILTCDKFNLSLYVLGCTTWPRS